MDCEIEINTLKRIISIFYLFAKLVNFSGIIATGLLENLGAGRSLGLRTSSSAQWGGWGSFLGGSVIFVWKMI